MWEQNICKGSKILGVSPKWWGWWGGCWGSKAVWRNSKNSSEFFRLHTNYRIPPKDIWKPDLLLYNRSKFLPAEYQTVSYQQILKHLVALEKDHRTRVKIYSILIFFSKKSEQIHFCWHQIRSIWIVQCWRSFWRDLPNKSSRWWWR